MISKLSAFDSPELLSKVKDIKGSIKQKDLVDFSECEIVNIPLGGAMSKFCVIYNNQTYLLKFDKLGSSATISEYIASRICNGMDMNCQEVLLGFYNGKRCCAIKSFSNYDLDIHAYKEINDSSVDDNSKDIKDLPYNLSHIKEVIENYTNCLDTVSIRLKKFQEMCFFDTLIGNFDRHWGNWGLLGEYKDYICCPLFDNGSSLFPSRLTENLVAINSSSNELLKRVYEFPTSQIRNDFNNRKMTYDNLIDNIIKLFGLEELQLFVNKFNSIDVKDLIYNDNVLNSVLTSHDKRFLYSILLLRFKLLLERKCSR